MLSYKRHIFVLCLALLGLTNCVEQGKFTAILSKGEKGVFPKTVYKDTKIKLTLGQPNCSPKSASLTLKWLIRSSSCFAEYATFLIESDRAEEYFIQPYLKYPNGGNGYYMTNQKEGEELHCGQAVVVDNSTNTGWIKYPPQLLNATAATTSDQIKKRDVSDAGSASAKSDAIPDVPPGGDKAPTENADDPKTGENSGKDVDPEKSEAKAVIEAASSVPDKKADSGQPSSDKENPPKKAVKTHRTENHVIAVTQYEASYVVIVSIEASINFTCDITVDMMSPKGYLSAHEYPLLTFYLIMCIVYTFYAVAWLIMSACNFRDLLRVQFWIGGVILLGMIEKAVFYSEYMSVNSTGESVTGAEKFAEVISALKRSLARMLVIIVSLGFGIVKPRLGPMLHRVIGVGMLFFILAVVEALVRTDTAMKDPNSNNLIFASIPLAVLDSIICWWIFVSLMQTMKTLRLRRNVVKLTLYRHFANTIIFCVLASFIMIIWSVHSRDQCLSEWQELWVDRAFWHILFSVILLVIMILWRPNLNNQRYAFSPLIDGEDEEVEEPMLGGGATETIKMRGLKNAADPAYNPANKAEEDLKWIEENIPQTVADAALPAIMDSDEEVMTTKYEMSKME